ncbi:MAG: GNAT family N-acetyltransferase [Pseudomonadota bacterium]
MDRAVVVRKARIGDASAVGRLYYGTVRTINARDHTDKQIEAWAPWVYPNGYWINRFKRYCIFVAELAGEIVGFAELNETGGIDCFYVHHLYQGRGVGARLMKRVEQQARKNHNARLHADVSVTAKAFFGKMGFRVVRRHKKIYRRRVFRQFQMAKPL